MNRPQINSHRVERTNTDRFAVISPEGETICEFHGEMAAHQTRRIRQRCRLIPENIVAYRLPENLSSHN